MIFREYFWELSLLWLIVLFAVVIVSGAVCICLDILERTRARRRLFLRYMRDRCSIRAEYKRRLGQIRQRERELKQAGKRERRAIDFINREGLSLRDLERLR